MQNKFLRIAYPSKLSTPIRVLEMIANLEPTHNRYRKLILRHWARSQYCSDFHPLTQTRTLIQSKLHKNSHFKILNDILNEKNINISIHKHPPIQTGPITAIQNMIYLNSQQLHSKSTSI